MKKLRRVMFAACALLLSGCAATVVQSGRDPALTAPIDSMRVVYVNGPLEGRDAKPSIGTVLGSPMFMPLGSSDARIITDSVSLGEHVLKALPAALRAAGVRVDGEGLQLRSLLTARSHMESSLGPVGSAAPALVIRPVSARMECPGACFVFRLEVELLDRSYDTRLWSATFDAPPKLSKLHDFSAPAASLSEVLVAQLRKDGVLR